MWFGTWFRRLVRRMIREELPIALVAATWTNNPADKNTKTCEFCGTGIPLGDMICHPCGTSQDSHERQTTGHYKLPPFAYQFNSVTGQISAAALPNERPMKTYNRVVKKNKRTIA